MLLNQFNQIGEDLMQTTCAIRSGASMDWPVMPFLFSFGGIELILMHAVFLLSFWERDLRVPAVVTALDGILLGVNMVWIFILFGRWPDNVIERIRFSCAADLLLELFSLALWVVWVSRYAAWSFDALTIIALQTLDVLLTLWVLRFLRLLTQADRENNP